MQRTPIGSMLADRRRNAVVAWLFLSFLGFAAAQSLLGADVLWAGFIAAALALGLVPPVVFRDPSVMLPWEVLAIATLPMVGRVFATVELTSDLAVYLSVAALALVVAVELHVFTQVRMSYGFAIFFVVVTTVAASGLWAVVRWTSDLLVGTRFLSEPGLAPAAIERAVMLEFVYSTAAGLLAGVVFELYFRRRVAPSDRLPAEVAGE